MKLMNEISHESQEKPGGNTKTPGNNNQLYRWFFTLRMEECTASQLSQLLKGFSKEFLFSGEKGEGGFEHWQGCFSLKQKEYFNTVKNHFPSCIHLEPCKHWWKANNYCKKVDTHICGPYTEKSTFIWTIEKLYPWQERIRKMCLEIPDQRTINWIWESEGNRGKTSFCKFMAVHYQAIVLSNGSLKDLACAIGDTSPTIILINLTRDLEERVNYSAFEAMKDGLMFSAKYESKMKLFNCPHIFIFANFEPRLTSCSADRWNVIRI